MASNKMKAFLLAGSLCVTAMGGQALAWENMDATTDPTMADTSGTLVETAVAIEPLTSTADISAILSPKSAVPISSNRRVELIIKPFSYTAPQTSTIESAAPTSTSSSQITTIDLSSAAVSPIDIQIPVAVAAVPAAINLNLAPVPKAINPPPVEVSIQAVTSTKSSR